MMQSYDSLDSFCAETDLKEKELLMIQFSSLKMSCLTVCSLLSFHKLNSIS